jgi:type I restriction enzyme S subunit
MKMQSIKRYEAYKDSGVEWLGKVPQHWTIKRLKDIGIGGLTNGIFKTKDQFGSGAKLVNVTDLYQNDSIINNEKLDRVCATQSEINRYCVRGGDIFFVRSSLKLEGIGVSAIFENGKEATVFECHIIRFRPNQKHVFPKFAIYQLNSNEIRYKFVVVSKTVTMTTISQDKISTIDLVYPAFREQQAIAAYLDTKTAQIDRKIELLSQKAAQYGKLKQSLINETVTRGLGKTVAMKDSGVEWIGKVPVHWEVKRVKELGNLVLGKMLDNVKGDNTFYRSYLKSKNIGWLKVEDSNIEKMYFSLAEMKSYRLKKDDILLSEGGEVGKTCFWNDEIEECYIQNSVHKITIYKNNSPRFFLYQSYLLGSIKYYDSIVSHVSIKHLTKEKLSRVNWVRPPFEEQTAIANYLDEKTAHIDRIVATINSQIDKLKELRLTLINDVVTGKIKVD